MPRLFSIVGTLFEKISTGLGTVSRWVFEALIEDLIFGAISFISKLIFHP